MFLYPHPVRAAVDGDNQVFPAPIPRPRWREISRVPIRQAQRVKPFSRINLINAASLPEYEQVVVIAALEVVVARAAV